MKSTDQNTNLSFPQSVNHGSIEKEKCNDRKYIEEKEAGDRVARHYRHPNSKNYWFKHTITILKTKNIEIILFAMYRLRHVNKGNVKLEYFTLEKLLWSQHQAQAMFYIILAL